MNLEDGVTMVRCGNGPFYLSVGDECFAMAFSREASDLIIAALREYAENHGADAADKKRGAK